jgi:formylmethanofuran dehydrogenase subunit E
MRMNASRWGVLVVLALAVPALADEVDAKLDAVAAVHGEAGAWAVAGYRMSEFALHTLGLKRGDFALTVEHISPREVRFACVVDGIQAATGASLGRLQLTLTEAKVEQLATVFKNKTSGQSLTLRPTAAFIKRFMEVPREQARAAGKQAMTLPAAEVFETVK